MHIVVVRTALGPSSDSHAASEAAQDLFLAWATPGPREAPGPLALDFTPEFSMGTWYPSCCIP